MALTPSLELRPSSSLYPGTTLTPSPGPQPDPPSLVLTDLGAESVQAVYRADLYSNSGDYVTELPLVGGELRGQSRALGRWSGRVVLAGDTWAPRAATDPLSGLSPYHVRLYGGVRVAGVDQLVEMARCPVGSTTVQRTAESMEVECELLSVGDYVDQAAPSDFTHQQNETCQAMIRRLVEEYKPRGWPTVLWADTTTPVTVPTGAAWQQVPAGQVIADLAAIANIAVYIDRDGSGVMRDPLPTTAQTITRAMGVGVDAVTITHTVGRIPEFANDVTMEFAPVGANSRARLRSDWTWSASSGTPTSGQIRYTNNTTSGELRVHDKDSAGRPRQVRQLDRVDSGDIIEVRTTGGDYAIYTCTYSIDQDTYWQIGVDVLSYNTAPFPSASSVELTAYVTPTDNVVGSARQTSGAAGTATAGVVTYSEYHVGNVTQAQANARAAAVLGVMLRGWSVTMLEAVPDVQLAPDHDVTVDYGDVVLTHRVTDVSVPVGVDRPMTVALRTLGGI